MLVAVGGVMNHLNHHCILRSLQYGSNVSTELALFKLWKNIYDAVHGKQFHLSILCDVLKASDSISHLIVLREISACGGWGKALDSFTNYSSARQQFTLYDKVSSYCREGENGVPQGSFQVLSFLLFINDIIYCIDSFNLILFPNDIDEIFHGRDIGNSQTETRKLNQT